MDERELPSDSDSSDEDFVPEGVDSDLPSEEESGPDDAELETGACSGDDDSKTKKLSKGRKRTLKKKGSSKRKHQKKDSSDITFEKNEEENKLEEKPVLSIEEEKKKADSLWADFMKDVGKRPARKPAVASTTKNEIFDDKSTMKSTTGKPTATSSTEKENKVTITKLFEFAGEEVRVTKEVDANSAEARLMKASSDEAGQTSKTNESPLGSGRGRGGGLSGISSVLSQIGKKAKISTLEKSKLDWERYKDQEGIQEEIQTHNRGKEGYLEKQDFLQRTDLRQFEIEKQLRATRRSNR